MAGNEDDRTMATLSIGDGSVLSAPQARRSALLAGRYEDLGQIGAGGMGEVRRVRDVALDRIVAMKLVAPNGAFATEHEARLTGRLQHPGIVTVHDMGVLEDGRLWFTMREVRGETLARRITLVHGASADGRWGQADGWGLRRLIGALEAVAQVVAYAHTEGVVHRDLKPSNVMIGAFGEVQVLDWGIAWILSGDEDTADRLVGTPAYMAPEQVARGAPVDTPVDVYALGGLLYRILSDARPYRQQGSHNVLTALRTEARWPLRDGASLPMPADLVELCEGAMVREPKARPTAERFAESLRQWLDGTRDRRKALSLAEGADEVLAKAKALRVELATLRRGAERELAELSPQAPVSAKLPSWRAIARSEQLERDAELLEVQYVEAQRAALNLAPDLDAAHNRLAWHYRERLADAERLNRGPEAVRYEALLRAHDRGTHAAWLDGSAEVELLTQPSEAEVWAERLTLRDRRIVAKPPVFLGKTPLRSRLAHGSWCLRLRREGFLEARYPVALERAGFWSTAPSGEPGRPVPLLPIGAAGDNEVYVPGGWFACGGDDEAPDALPARRVWVDGFLIGRFPVTHAEYLAFVQDTWDRTGTDVAVPRDETQSVLLYELVAGRWQVAPLEGRAINPSEPVILIDWPAAMAFAAWQAERSGLPYRLPMDLEWEKAARGVDGRVFPFGPHLDPTWTRMQLSSPDEPGPTSVYDHPEDESVYGVRVLAGNVRQWCLNGYDKHGPDGDRVIVATAADDAPYRMVRGGSWHSGPLFCRSAGRMVARPDDRRRIYGVRLCRSLGSP